MRRTSRSTIKEVASVAGVSTQTVSRVINERPDVSPTTRTRVLQVIQELRYQPSALARSLIRQRSETLGVVTAGLKYIGPSRTLSGITSAAEEAGYAVLLKELPRFDANNIEPIFQALLARHVDGIIWAIPEIGKNRSWVNKRSLDLEVPIVFLTMQPQERVHIVPINNYLGGRMAMAHLFEQGYQRVGHISGPLDWWESRQRKAAWKDALLEAGLEFREEYCVEGNWSSASGSLAIEKLLKQYPDIDSIFVANDDDAYAWVRESLRQDRHFLGSMNTLGVVYLRRGALAQATAAFGHVLERDADNRTALANLSTGYARQDRIEESMALQRRLARLESDPPFHYFNLGLAAMKQKDFGAAQAMFSRELARDDDYHEFHYWLGLANFELGNVEQARRNLARALEASTTHRERELYSARLDWMRARGSR